MPLKLTLSFWNNFALGITLPWAGLGNLIPYTSYLGGNILYGITYTALHSAPYCLSPMIYELVNQQVKNPKAKT